jgi:hypothetical protein
LLGKKLVAPKVDSAQSAGPGSAPKLCAASSITGQAVARGDGVDLAMSATWPYRLTGMMAGCAA